METDSGGLKAAYAKSLDLCKACSYFNTTQICDTIRKNIPSNTTTTDTAEPQPKNQRLDSRDQIDLEESELDNIMDSLARENLNEVARQIQEIGHSFTASIETCQQRLLSILGDVHSLDAPLVARIISMMITTPGVSPGVWDPGVGATGAEQSLPWNGQVFVQTVKSLTPSLNWSDVVSHLDHPYFNVSSKAALQLLMQILLEGIDRQFPLAFLCGRVWNGNKTGQLSWIAQIVQNPDVFYVLSCMHRPVNCSSLKVMPDDSNKGAAQWKCLDLVEVLFRLSETSQLAPAVYNLLKAPGPMAQCPDILMLGVVQIPISIGQLRIHILKQLVALLLSGHANSVAVLGFAWNFETNRQQLRQIILTAMASYYAQSPDDQSRLTKILGIAHELKPNGLAELLNFQQQLPFVIDLACLASRRDFLKLDKFLEDKLNDHGQSFAEHLCAFLKRRCPGLPGSVNPIPSETFQVLFTVLQSRSNLSPLITAELGQILLQMRGGTLTGPGIMPPSQPAPGPTGAYHRDTPPWQPPTGAPASVPMLGAQRTMTPVAAGPPSQAASRMGPGRTAMPMNRLGQPMNPNSGGPPMDQYSGSMETVTFSEEVQEEANLYFQQIYSRTGRMSVNDFIQRLKNFRDSNNQREKDLLMCVVKNLFDEYRFFHEYPDQELRTTAELYGGIIREAIVQNIEFAIAVRKVIEALKSEPGQPLWRFGIVALNACRTCLYKYPRDYVNSGLQGMLPNSQPADRDTPSSWPTPLQPPGAGPGGGIGNLVTTPGTPSSINVSGMKFQPTPGLKAGGTSILNVTNVDTLINATEKEGNQVKQPAQVIFEKVSFLCNNLSQTNLLRKEKEIKEIMAECGDDFIHWLAQYLVMKRVTVEQNFQPLYNLFLITISDEKLDDYVKKETFRNVDILLRSDKRQAVSNFGDRQLLKNLGHWLGIITIGRDKPILAKDLDMKYLLLEAFYKGQQELLYIVPFVVKTLLASNKSKIFGPRCAWVYAIIKVLVEIHNEPDLKLNLKFEIEVLCKDLQVDLRSVEVGNYLKESSRLPKLTMKPEGPSPVPVGRLGPVSIGLNRAETISGADMGGPSLLAPALGRPSAASVTPMDGAVSGLLQPRPASASLTSTQPPPQPMATFHYNDINIHMQDGLSQHLKDPSHLPLFQQYPHLKVLCKTAIVHAIKELIGGITDRSINVAITATEHVCRKDFAMDPDEQHLHRAAHQMMRAMTAGMASITCREPLATTIMGYLKQALFNHLGTTSPPSPEQVKMVEEAAFSVTEANLEVATNFIVKSACEKAASEMEKRLETEFVARQSAKKEGRVFQADTEIVAMTKNLPEQIRPKPGFSLDVSLKIYDDFSSKICGFKPLSAQEMFSQEIFAKRGPMTPGAKLMPNQFPTFPVSVAEGLRPGSTTLPQPPPGTTPMGMNSMDRSSQPPLPILPAHIPETGVKVDDEQAALQVKVESILREWISICYTPLAQRDPQHALACIVKMMHQSGVLSTDEMISKFFKICVDICLDVSYRLLKNDTASQSTVVRQRCHYTLDAFVKLTCLMVKYSDGTHHSTKVNLLKKVLGILTTALHADHETRKTEFNGMPFHRILIIMFNELTAPDPILEPITWNILEAFGQALFVLQPRRLPGFAFHWLDIIGHRNFIGRLLSESFDLGRTGAMYTQLILCHLKFLAPFLRNVQLPRPIAFIYKGTLRVLLVILHDFPEILCEYHYVLCDVIPANCVQLRNLVLSAYPRDMRLPDPFTQSMEMIESLPEMSVNPKMHREMSNIIPNDLRTKLDDYLESRSPVRFLSELPSSLQVSQQTGSKYNVSVMNAVVMYVGIRAIDSIHEKQQRISMATIAHTAYMDIFQNLAVSLCTEGRYLLFNAIANQLRYPNSHTHYFSCTLLYLFLEANTEIIQEQITRILFERLVALRPHPWGLLITFIELIRNRRYDFWRHEFVRCAPEIERLFTSVANSCSVGAAVPDQQITTNGVEPQRLRRTAAPVHASLLYVICGLKECWCGGAAEKERNTLSLFAEKKGKSEKKGRARRQENDEIVCIF
ncbi:CCR4-Not complex component, not1 domain-containing protein [Ditylenchus destructor]|uniref:CCR4-Not complex component, not1 domain-containing protein n=1 Tax=Ditylenchus destructor TaxID=166010 RepID=A0AAD4N6P2_9BILA|nr:CCR4-Not complex component, not1 domain-containing protein [Ditylenchus destructor]